MDRISFFIGHSLLIIVLKKKLNAAGSYYRVLPDITRRQIGNRITLKKHELSRSSTKHVPADDDPNR